MFTTLPAIAFPVIDPVIFSIGPFAVRWYALAYIVGLVLGWRMAMRIAAKPSSPDLAHAVTPQQIDGFLIWATLGVVLGGRLGYVLFYNLDHYLQHPAGILAVWQGGMSFHGGMLGVILAMLIYCRRIGAPLFVFTDIIACVAPIGLFFGRIANFINGELWGRVAPDVPWAMVFPTGGPEPRHPSQLYQAGMEGLLLFLLLNLLRWNTGIMQRHGMLTGVFLIGYGLARIIGELFRQPDAQIGYLIGGTTMGQWLSLPMVLFGIGLIWWARKRAAA
ncbi:prolipoprotein diacylglyceryl transferase [uncultured Ferrovibrio sp.]|jgi:prolipoprotein diacylglyceryl transferase|uniref:prolipoprotein diacylglyceryl transferase n=1 Tax=uncultured Ferrovibrio sp. TaxID=1576913 RepID=UPI002616A8DC|nr:prolipoprotein diacylglyceryl transferase [uncultured Ferrovibrio sp.]